MNELPAKSIFDVKRPSSFLSLLGTVILALRFIKLRCAKFRAQPCCVHFQTCISTNGIFTAIRMITRIDKDAEACAPANPIWLPRQAIDCTLCWALITHTKCRPLSIAIVLNLLGFIWTLFRQMTKGAKFVCQLLAWITACPALVFNWFNICGTTTALTDQSKTSFLTAERYLLIHQAGTTAAATSTSFLHAGNCLCVSQAGINRAVTDEPNMKCSSLREISTNARQREVSVMECRPSPKARKRGSSESALHHHRHRSERDHMFRRNKLSTASKLVTMNDDEEGR